MLNHTRRLAKLTVPIAAATPACQQDPVAVEHVDLTAIFVGNVDVVLEVAIDAGESGQADLPMGLVGTVVRVPRHAGRHRARHGVNDVYVPGRPQDDAPGVIELPWTGAEAAPLRLKGAGRSESLHEVVLVQHVDRRARISVGEVDRQVELAVPAALRTPLASKIAGRIENLNAMVPLIQYVYLAGESTDADGRIELPFPTAEHPPLAEKRPVAPEFHDAVVAGIRYVENSASIHRHSLRLVQPAVTTVDAFRCDLTGRPPPGHEVGRGMTGGHRGTGCERLRKADAGLRYDNGHEEKPHGWLIPGHGRSPPCFNQVLLP